MLAVQAGRVVLLLVGQLVLAPAGRPVLEAAVQLVVLLAGQVVTMVTGLAVARHLMAMARPAAVVTVVMKVAMAGGEALPPHRGGPLRLAPRTLVLTLVVSCRPSNAAVSGRSRRQGTLRGMYA